MLLKIEQFQLGALIIVSLLLCSCQSSHSNTDKTIIHEILDVKSFNSAISADTDIQLIDVRTVEEVNQGMISGAQVIDFKSDSFDIAINKLDPTVPTYVYCRSGRRSAKSCVKLKKLGFKELYDLEGGFDAWSSQ